MNAFLKIFLTCAIANFLLPDARAEVKKKTKTTATPAPKKNTPATPKEAAPQKPKPDDDSATAKKSATLAPAQETAETPTKRERAPAATLEPNDLADFAAASPGVQQLITAALELTKLNLTYTYGSAEPARGGMDCSGTIYYLLRAQGFSEVPRDSSGQYMWVRKVGPFFAVVSRKKESSEFGDLRPGDLLFWTGTYETERDVPISHVMLYLGKEKKSDKRVMFGASDGRSYNGIQRWGVSVFDFTMPATDPDPAKRRVDFVGYGRIPGMRETGAAEVPAPAAESADGKGPDKLPAPTRTKKKTPRKSR